MTVTKTSGSFTQSGQLEATYSYDTEGKLSSMTYPTEHLDDPAYPGQYRYLATTGLTYNYSYDTLGRPNAMSSLAHSRTGNQAVTWVDNVSYGAANEMLGMRYRLDAANGQAPVNYYNETRQYNNRLQLTQLSAVPTGGAATSLTMNYVYPANGNNGMLYQASDNLAGEVTYQYDSLNRLISAATTDNSWGLSFAYDGFGNRTDQTVTKGTAVESHLTFALATNRISSAGYAYDSNGNLTQMPGASGSVTLEYDIENRLTRYYYAAGGVDERYGYGPSNERIWKGVLNQDLQDEVFFYGIDGKLLGRYRPALSGACGLMLTPLGKNVYFAGKLIRSQDRTVVMDRLGSVRIAYNESTGEQLSKYYPFGEEIAQVTTQQRDKFGTYYRDASSGLDYAMNRYYSSSTLGRFLMPDPYLGSANPGNPQTWNRYTYVNNDPINKIDPSGLNFELPGDDTHSGGGWWDDPWGTMIGADNLPMFGYGTPPWIGNGDNGSSSKVDGGLISLFCNWNLCRT